MCSAQTIFNICSRDKEEEDVDCSAQSAYNEAPIPPLLAEEILLLSSNWGEGANTLTHRKEADCMAAMRH
jgi:hypothetical protein